MCGFAGILGPSDQSELLRMGSAIKHRGPDSGGLWIDENQSVALVHQRLAVVDISEAGHQPMPSLGGRYQLAYNGEIYNHLELRQQLEMHEKFNGWRGHSDTETLLTSIELLGLHETLPLLTGMFAFALWDNKTSKLHLVRDRIGEKPLYYGWHGDRFLFASELHALRSSAGFYPEINRRALPLYFRHNYFPAPYSVYKGIYKLTSGSLLTMTAAHRIEKSVATPLRYWSAVDCASKASQTPFTGTEKEAEDEVDRLLSASIADQMVADVPVGVFLSGGIDSSTVTALMQKQSKKRIKSFCIGFKDENYNEANHARTIAQHLQTDHHEMLLGDSDAQNLVARLPALLDEPFADASQLPTLMVAELARQHVTVCLSGDGGDELFGGYTRHIQAAKVIKHRRRLGSTGRTVVKALVNSPIIKSGPTGIVRFAGSSRGGSSRLQTLARGLQLLAHDSDAEAYCDMLSFWRHPNSPLCNANQIDPYPIPLLNPTNWFDATNAQSAVQLLDVQHFLTDDILCKVDRAAMSVSLETRIPLLDHRLMAFVWSLPTSMRANPAKPKSILKFIACRHLPSETIERPKMGFGIPLAAWLRGPLKNWASSLVNSPTLKSQGLLDAKTISTLWSQVLNGDDYSADALWSVLVLQQWLDVHHS